MAANALYEVLDPRFSAKTIGSAALEEICTGFRWAEGPVWFNDHQCLYFSDIPNQRIMRHVPADGSTSIFREPSGFTNGHARDKAGRLISCEHGGRRVIRTETDGTITVLVDAFEGKKLNSPNDLVAHSDGSIWFTDPTYGIMSDYEGYAAVPEQPTRGVYRIDGQSGAVTRVADDFNQPNGLAFSVDESKLFVADSGSDDAGNALRHIRVFDVTNGQLGNGRVFAHVDAGVPDGLRVDSEGWVWSSAGDGVQVFTPEGTLAGKIRVPQTVSNLVFGGSRGNRLFMTATQSVYALYVNARGAVGP